MKIAVLVDATKEIGLGHFYRCVNLAKMFLFKGNEVDIIFQEFDDELVSILTGLKFYKAPFLPQLFSILQREKYSLIITDFNKELKFNSLEEYEAFYNCIRKTGVIVAFDEYNHWPIGSADAFIIPYPEVEKHLKLQNGVHYFTGLKYMFFSKEFYGRKARIRESINEVLIFMGGTDPFGFSKKILKFFTEFNHNVSNFILITGKNSSLDKMDLKEFSGKLNIEFVKGTNQVADFMEKVDIGIVNSGLVKYEAAFLGLPLITISNEVGHEPIMKAFQRTTLNPHLGLGINLVCSNFTKCFYDLNLKKRLEIHQQTAEVFSDDRFLLVNELLKMAE